MINLSVIDSDLEDADEVALRHALRRELEQNAAALALRDKAQATVEAAKKHLAGVENELRQYDDLDEKIATKRATRIAESLEAGGGVPDLDTPELHQLIIRRGEADNRRAAFAQALTKLEGSLAEAERTLAARKSNVDSAALAIVGHVVDGQARALKQVEEHAATLRRRLIGSCALRPGAQIPLASATLAMLRDDPPNAVLSRNDGSEAPRWNQLFARLCNDPEARIDD